MTDEELFWPGLEGDCGDYDDDFLQEEGVTTVSAGGTGVAPGEGTVPSLAERRKKRLIRRRMPVE